MPDQTRRDYYQRALEAMKRERESFIPQYQDLSRFVQPRRGRFSTSDRNKGDRRWSDIINSRATQALRIATAGIFNGIMSPSRPWLTLETDDPNLREHWAVKPWFYEVQSRMLRIFSDSNLYNMSPTFWREALLFGTACMHHMDDDETVARFYTHTAGSYVIAQDDRYNVTTVAQELEMTVIQAVRKFSENGNINPRLSYHIRSQYDRGNYHEWVPIVHFTEPNPDTFPGEVRANKRPFRSVYYEPSHPDRNLLLRESGFYEFPFYVLRWETTGEDIYATDCPGMTALGDVRQLQFQEKRKAQGLDKMVSPVLHGPAALRHTPIRNTAGMATLYDAPGQNQGLRSVYDVNLPIGELVQDMDRVEQRINEAFFVPLFQAITAMEGVQPRNEVELMQRHQERLHQLGPVLERSFGDFLTPLVNRTFNQMQRAGLIPPPPKALWDRPLRPRFVSTMAMAQQSASTSNIERIAGFVGQLVALGFQNAAEKFDAEQAVDAYGEFIGVDPRIILPDEVVQQRREQRQKQEQAAMALQAGQQAANIAKTAGDTKVGPDTLAGLLSQNANGGRPQ